MPHLIPLQRDGSNVVAFPVPSSQARTTRTAPGADPWRAYTRTLILAKASRGELEPGILEALMDNAGVEP